MVRQAHHEWSVTVIHLLDESLIQKIAAGEVIERPASVVKELVENAIDAGAKAISIEISGAGCDEIGVTDDGCGMGSEDLELSIRRHATSKISSEGDLGRIATLGFRGEALAAIAQVSRLTLESRPRDDAAKSPTGDDAAKSPTGEAAPSGYRLEVEGGRAAALAPCGLPIGTRVKVRDLFFNTPARKKFLRAPVTERMQIEKVITSQALAHPGVRWLLKGEGEVIVATEGSGQVVEVLRAVIGPEVASRCRSIKEVRGPLTVSAWLGDPVQAQRSAQKIFIMINGRVVSDRGLVRAMIDGYGHRLLTAHFPTIVLALEIPPDQVDVNVHPTKAEVRFANPRAVYDCVREMIARVWTGETSDPGSSVVLRQAPFDQAQGRQHERSSCFTDRPELVEGPEPVDKPFVMSLSNHERLQLFPSYSTLRPLGQLAKTYIVCEGPKGLVLVDQHAAHERIGFEALKREYREGAVRRQILLVPITVELKPSQAEVLGLLAPDLAPFGLVVEPFGRSTYIIKEVPALLSEADFPALVTELIEAAEDGPHLAPLKTRAEEVLERMACHRQLRAGDSLSPPEIRTLLDAAERAGAYQCPHGRPAVVEMPLEEIERRFRRRV